MERPLKLSQRTQSQEIASSVLPRLDCGVALCLRAPIDGKVPSLIMLHRPIDPQQSLLRTSPIHNCFYLQLFVGEKCLKMPSMEIDWPSIRQHMLASLGKNPLTDSNHWD